MANNYFFFKKDGLVAIVMGHGEPIEMRCGLITRNGLPVSADSLHDAMKALILMGVDGKFKPWSHVQGLPGRVMMTILYDGRLKPGYDVT